MNNLPLIVPRPLLCTLNFLLEEDDFVIDSVSVDETRYTRVHCGWTCRVRAVVATTRERTARRRRSTSSNTSVWEYLALQIEIQRVGISSSLTGNVVRPARDAVGLYLRNVRAVVQSFPLALCRAKLADVPPSADNWRATPFASVQVLEYLAHVRWQDGRLEEARECYQALLPYAVGVGDTAVVLQCLEQLKARVPYKAEH